MCSYTMHIIGLDISLVLLFCFSISDKHGGTRARDKNRLFVSQKYQLLDCS